MPAFSYRSTTHVRDDGRKPLQPYDREAFLFALGSYFTGHQAISDGELKYAIRQSQRKHFSSRKYPANALAAMIETV